MNNPTTPTKFYKYIPNPEKPGYLTFDRMITFNEMESAITDYLKSQKLNEEDKDSAYDYLDYISCDCEYRKNLDDPIPNLQRFFAYMTEGSNEGYYFHLAGINPKEEDIVFTSLLTAKTLCNKEIALKISELFTRFMMYYNF